MEQAEAVGSEAGDVLVVNKVLALDSEGVLLVPVPPNRQDIIASFY
jgi:hypothetical protein